MKNQDVSTRRQLLARKNYGRRDTTEFLGNLSLAVSQRLKPKDLVSLEQTDRLYDHYEESFRLAIERKVPSYRQLWLAEEKDALESKLNCFRDKVIDSGAVLFSRGFDHCGAVRVRLHEALEHIFELILIDGDSVRLLDESESNGLIVDSHDDSEETYEMVLWGDIWRSAIEDC